MESKTEDGHLSARNRQNNFLTAALIPSGRFLLVHSSYNPKPRASVFPCRREARLIVLIPSTSSLTLLKKADLVILHE